MLAGCGESQPQILGPANVNAVGSERAHQQTFEYTGKAQSFTVPARVTRVTVTANGASGPSQGGSSCYFTGGRAGVVKAAIAVTPGETLAIYVGGEGMGNTSNCSARYEGGYNGGGNGGNEAYCLNGTGGGGASDVRQGGTALRNRVIIAGGGGGGGIALSSFYAGNGGDGGGEIGGHGTDTYVGGYGGAGGTQHHGGKGGDGGMRSDRGSHGYAGKFGIGGAGGNGQFAGCGGGGGGGYYGGGGGGAGSSTESYCSVSGGGGGGGSSYIEPSAKSFTGWQGWKNAVGNGLIVISW